MCRLHRNEHVLTSPFVPVVVPRIREASTDATKRCTSTYSQSVRKRRHRKHGIYKRKTARTEEEHRKFHRDWTESFAFICNSDGLPTCLICDEKLAHNKKSNLERHFTTKHTQSSSKYSAGEERKKAVTELQKQQSSFILSNWTQSTKRRLRRLVERFRTDSSQPCQILVQIVTRNKQICMTHNGTNRCHRLSFFTLLNNDGLEWNSYPGFSSGRPRGTTPADDRYIVLQARRNRRQTAGEIARHTTQATGRPISRFTVARRLHGGGLFARRPVRCVPLTLAHRRRRSLWCREHWNWRDNEWRHVLFTDESRFSLSSDSHRILIWRERGSRNHPSNIIERDRYGGRGVLVWGGIMLGSRTDLHIFDAGSVNGTRYCNEILLPYVRLFRGAMVLQFLFMDDNAPCHRTVAAEQLLESEDIERMDWPARSPDLNPIEHVWDFLGRRLAARTLPPVTIRELRLALQDEWAAMPQQLIDTLILSMGRRCETCLAVRGDHIPY
ncbi:transposable element Tcb2 transposase [Trichonephila clavipes]|nr:transposable element Tcb2 transposase [Trichonephila clavipes]